MHAYTHATITAGTHADTKKTYTRSFFSAPYNTRKLDLDT